MTGEALNIVKEAAQIPGLLKEIYGDLAKPGVKQIGNALGTIFGPGNTILWPLMLINEITKITIKANLEKYRLQMQNVPEDKIVSVVPEVGVPICEKLAYVSNEELSNLYVNLLAKASTIETDHFAHPSFVNLINSLSPDEAVLLGNIHSNLPFVTARSVSVDKPTIFTEKADLLTGLENKLLFTFPHNIAAYFSNFAGLGMIEIRRNIVSDHPAQFSLDGQSSRG